MERALEKGKTLLTSGPASVALMSGEVSALGFGLPIRRRVVVRRGKAIPFEALENSCLEIVLSGDASVEEMDGSTLPDSWKMAAEAALRLPKPCTVAVLGDVDSGKNTFCIYLVNRSLAAGLKPVVIDADIGQSEIGPPATIGLATIQEPTLDFFSLCPEAVFFVGLTSPGRVGRRVVDGLIYLKKCVKSQLTVVNTDGWVREGAAIHYKGELIRSLSPEAVVAIQSADELEPILALAQKYAVLRVASPSITRKRDRESRRGLREQSYRKFLKEAKTRFLPIERIRFESVLSSDAAVNFNRLRELGKALCHKILYCEENLHELIVMVDDPGAISAEQIVIAEKFLEKTIHIIGKEDARGLLLGLLDDERRFLGLGVLSEIDCVNKVLKIVTPCRERVSVVQFGRIKVDRFGREIGYVSSFLDYTPK